MRGEGFGHRDFAAVMPGDLVLDGDGRGWQVVGPDADGSMTLQGNGGVVTVTGLRADSRVWMAEGPGWGARGAGDEQAMTWAVELAVSVLDASVTESN